MNLAKHPEAKIPNWRGPKYPARLAKLAEVYAANPGKTGIGILIGAGKGIMGFVKDSKSQHATCSNGYQWYHALEFKVIGGSVLVAFPRRPEQGLQLERLPAVYTSRRLVPPLEVDSVLVALIRELGRS